MAIELKRIEKISNKEIRARACGANISEKKREATLGYTGDTGERSIKLEGPEAGERGD